MKLTDSMMEKIINYAILIVLLILASLIVYPFFYILSSPDKASIQEKPLERSEVNSSPMAVFTFKNNDKREVAIAFYNGCEYFMVLSHSYFPIHVASCTNNIHFHK